MIPQRTVVADLTRSEDELSLKPGYAVGDCHARRLPSVHEAQRPWAAKGSGVNTQSVQPVMLLTLRTSVVLRMEGGGGGGGFGQTNHPTQKNQVSAPPPPPMEC